MTTTDYSVLDRPETSMNSFYPRKNWAPMPDGAEEHAIAVEEQIALSCRFFPVDGRGRMDRAGEHAEQPGSDERAGRVQHGSVDYQESSSAA